MPIVRPFQWVAEASRRGFGIWTARFSVVSALRCGMTSTTAGDGRLEDIAVRDPSVSAAVDEPMRAMILDALSETAMTASEVYDALEKRGVDRTENTIRHHINELRDAGLVDVVRFEEGRGGTRKFYRANTIVLSYSLPRGSEDLVSEMVEAATPYIEDAVSALETEFDSDLDTLAAEMGPCEHCQTQKYETYILLTVLRRAFVQAYREPAVGKGSEGER